MEHNQRWFYLLILLPSLAFAKGGGATDAKPKPYNEAVHADMVSTKSGKLTRLKQTGAGVAVRPVLDPGKTQGSVSITDFGAVGDGVTNDAPAINAAISSGAKYIEIPVPTVRYKLTQPINMTGAAGVTLKALGATNVNVPMFLVAHAGVGFDLTGAYDCVLDNIGAEGDAAATPKAMILLARNSTHATAGRHRFINIHSNGKWSVAPVYSYASEENDYYSPWLQNTSAGGKVVVITSSNISALTSSFVTIDKGGQSNVGSHFFGGSFLVTGNSGKRTESAFYLESAGDVSISNPFMYCAYCRAYVYADMTNGASDVVSISGMRGEISGALPDYGVLLGNEAVRGVQNWAIENSRVAAINEVFYVSDNVTLSGLLYRNITAPQGKAVSARNLEDSHIESGSSLVTGRTGGTNRRNIFDGWKVNATFSGTNTSNVYIDTHSGLIRANGFEFPPTRAIPANENTLNDYKEGTWTCGLTFATPGDLAITYAARQCRYVKIGRLVTVQGYISTSTFTYATASGVFQIVGLPFAGEKGGYSFSPINYYQGFTSPSFTSLAAQIGGTTAAYIVKSGADRAPANTTTTEWPSGSTVSLGFTFSYMGN